VRLAAGGRRLERLAGGRPRGRPPSPPRRWRTIRSGPDPWQGTALVDDQAWLRSRPGSLARSALQQGLLFPTARLFARPRVAGADDLAHAPQPAVIAPNHASDIDTPLILDALPRAWRSRTVVGAASDRFYRRRTYAALAGLWINTFPFDRGGDLRGLAAAAGFLRDGYNVLLYPQGTRSSGLEGFRTGVARLCTATGAPLVPVHVEGTALIMPKDRGLTQRGRASVTFGRPIYPRPGEEPERLSERTSEAIAALEPRRGRT
jgi:1-acyl-sn-glycerol-3-phosphate acyltransferase